MPYHITVGAPLAASQKHQVEKLIADTFDEVNLVYNNWNPDSEISRLNCAPANQPIPLSDPLYQLLILCDEIVRLSEGRFDPTVAPLVALWRGHAPTQEELQELAQSVGWHHLALRDHTLTKDNARVTLDLCSLSKGHALDLLSTRLEALGYRNTLVEWAGELCAKGEHPSNRPWTIQIDPCLQVHTPIPLHNAAIATSGTYIQPHHIIDPRTARPCHGATAITAIAPTCALADALATAAMVFSDKTDLQKWTEHITTLYPSASFFILSHDP